MTGDDLRGRRAALGLSQARLGALLGVPQNTISRWELGTLAIERPVMLDLALTQLEERAMRPQPTAAEFRDAYLTARAITGYCDRCTRWTIVYWTFTDNDERHAPRQYCADCRRALGVPVNNDAPEPPAP